jgi:hypothetical protein
MKSGTWKFKAFLLAVGIVLIAATAVLWPRLSFWQRKQQAFEKLDGLDIATRNRMLAKLSAETRHIPTIDNQGKAVTVRLGGWTFSLPAARYRFGEDANDSLRLAADKLNVVFDGVRSKKPDFSAHMAPSNPEVIKYFREVDPYRMLLDAYNSTPKDIQAATTSAELQKSLYLLLLRTALQPNGAEKLWQRLDVRGRRSFLSGDANSTNVIASIYLPQTRQFAEIALEPHDGATMDDIYNCLGELDIQRDPNAPVTPARPSLPWPSFPETKAQPN